MPSSCGCGCGAFVAKKGLFTKGCAKRLGTVCDPRGVQKAANAINNPINNPINNAARAAARPALSKSDAELGLAKIVRYSPEYLRTVVAIALRRPEIQLLWASGSRHFTYWFFWTCEVAAGWRATAEQLASAERRESTHTMCSSLKLEPAAHGERARLGRQLPRPSSQRHPLLRIAGSDHPRGDRPTRG